MFPKYIPNLSKINNKWSSMLRGYQSGHSTVVINKDDFLASGRTLIPTTAEMDILRPESLPIRQAFRVMDLRGNFLPNAPEITINQDQCRKMYETMVRLQAFDEVMYNAQRQGRISFYIANIGEEAVAVGSASALEDDDIVCSQYREAGVIFWRGFSIQQAADQCFSNEKDLGKGKQMPVHYGSKKLNFQTISSTLATQLPQAVGAAYALKVAGEKRVVMCYFGEGAASEGDFHAALNFSATLEVPIIFLCRNNGYAISTNVLDQYRGDGIISRAAGYGMHSIRVDGNDLFAVYLATKEARKLSLELNKPVLIEAITYRQSHHSTSDDSSRYRDATELKYWESDGNPVIRFKSYMENKGWWNSELEQNLRDAERVSVLQAIEIAEARPKPPMNELFNDVYKNKSANLILQEQELMDHISKYPEQYRDSEH